jgi:cell division protein FtsI/penicillin-binding protein 2
MTRHHSLKVGVLATGLLVLASCTSGPDAPPASDTADSLAAALSKGDLSGVTFAPGTGATADVRPQKWWNAAVGTAVASPRTVRVTKVKQGDDAATVTLAYDWDLARTGAHWKYDTTARLTRSGDRWRVARSPRLVAPTLRPGQHLELTSEPAPRGEILGSGGVPLVAERPVMRFGIDKTQVTAARQPQAARRLADLLDIDPGAYVAAVRAAGPKAFVEALVLRDGDVKQTLRDAYPSIKGAVALEDTMPLAPTREFARPILGTVGPVTAEIVKKSNGAYQAGDEAGLSGLEQRYDTTLRGTPGVVVRATAGSDTRRKLFQAAARPGQPLRTSLDERLQASAEEVLSGVRPASALVAIRPSDGAILAAASGPGSNGYSTATVGTYAPGSTFKVVSSLALLRAGLTPSTTVPCPPTTVVDGKSFKNYDDYPSTALGRIQFRRAFANSCNTAFISQRHKVSQGDLVDAAASLGLGVDHDLGFPAYFGAVPRTADTTGHAASLIGQGQVLASPFAMATVAASVAHGSTVVPHLLDGKTATGAASPSTGDATPATGAGVGPSPGADAVPLTRAEASRLRALMRGVVTGGSGTFLQSLPGAPVLAKTGTAEFGNADPPQTHAWMIAVRDDLAVAVFVDVGSSGSGTAGPLLERFLRSVG